MNSTLTLQNSSDILDLSRVRFDGHALITLLISLGIFSGNIIIIVVSTRERVFQSKTAGRLIIALAVVDVLIGVNYALGVPNITLKRWIFSETACVVSAAFGLGIFAIEMYLIAAISLERYVAICRPLHYNRILSKRTWRVAGVLTGAYVTTLAIIPPIAEMPYDVTAVIFVCQFHYSGTTGIIYGWLYGILVCLLTLCIVMISNIRIVQTIRQQRRTINSLQGGQSQPVKIDKGSFISVLLIVITFVTMTPTFIIVSFKSAASLEINTFWPAALYVSNSFWNIFVYIGWNKAFRQVFIKLMLCKQTRMVHFSQQPQ